MSTKSIRLKRLNQSVHNAPHTAIECPYQHQHQLLGHAIISAILTVAVVVAVDLALKISRVLCIPDSPLTRIKMVSARSIHSLGSRPGELEVANFILVTIKSRIVAELEYHITIPQLQTLLNTSFNSNYIALTIFLHGMNKHDSILGVIFYVRTPDFR